MGFFYKVIEYKVIKRKEGEKIKGVNVKSGISSEKI